MAQESNIRIVQPQQGFQEKFAAANVDVVFGGGALNAGKSYAIILSLAQYLMTDPDFCALISRKAREALKVGGGFVQKFKDVFGSYIHIKESDNPRVSFPCGSFCDMTYIDSSDMKKLVERAKGWEYDVIVFDEITEVSWDCFTYLFTRNRGRSKNFTGHLFATLNPKRSHWSREFLDWYIGADGCVDPKKDGRVRFFYNAGHTVKDVVWGDTKREVYEKCKYAIDRKLDKANAHGGKYTYENFIKSFVFYAGVTTENKAIMDVNPDYMGSIAAAGDLMSESLGEGNFNVDPEDEYDIPIPSDKARECFSNDPAVNGDKWITADLADFGKDNLVVMAFNGCHCYDMLIVNHSTPWDNATQIKSFAQTHNIPENHIIYDGTAGRYLNGYIPDAIPFLSASIPIGIYALTAHSIKDLCAMRLCKLINSGQFTFDENVARKIYTHQKLKYPITVENEFLEECAVVRFRELPSGKKRLYSKKEMNAKLGKDRSMDVFDPCNMLMLHYVNIEYGKEIISGYHAVMEEEAEDAELDGRSVNIYDPTLFS